MKLSVPVSKYQQSVSTVLTTCTFVPKFINKSIRQRGRPVRIKQASDDNYFDIFR